MPTAPVTLQTANVTLDLVLHCILRELLHQHYIPVQDCQVVFFQEPRPSTEVIKADGDSVKVEAASDFGHVEGGRTQK
jgi:hypothetical protein